MPAPIALLDVTAEHRCTTLLNRSHRPALLAGGPMSVLLQESFAVPPDHIGDFERWP
jgi:hypothetical protein